MILNTKCFFFSVHIRQALYKAGIKPTEQLRQRGWMEVGGIAFDELYVQRGALFKTTKEGDELVGFAEASDIEEVLYAGAHLRSLLICGRCRLLPMASRTTQPRRPRRRSLCWRERLWWPCGFRPRTRTSGWHFHSPCTIRRRPRPHRPTSFCSRASGCWPSMAFA